MISIKRWLRALSIMLFAIPVGYAQQHPQHKSIISGSQIILSYTNKTDSPRYTIQTDTLILPVADKNHPALRKALSVSNLLGSTVKEIKKEYAGCGCGTVGSDFSVMFEKEGVISIEFNYESESAYPSAHQDWYTLNIRTGKPYPIAAEINKKGRIKLLAMFKDTLLRRIRQDKATNGADEDTSTVNELNRSITQLTASELFSKYVFTKSGIILSIEPILPHVIQALEPDDDVAISYDKLKPYLAPGSIIVKSAK